jgi:hypothetical protein
LLTIDLALLKEKALIIISTATMKAVGYELHNQLKVSTFSFVLLTVFANALPKLSNPVLFSALVGDASAISENLPIFKFKHKASNHIIDCPT